MKTANPIDIRTIEVLLVEDNLGDIFLVKGCIQGSNATNRCYLIKILSYIF